MFWILATSNFSGHNPLGLAIFLKNSYSSRSMLNTATDAGTRKKELKDKQQISTEIMSPLFKGKDAIIYQIIRSLHLSAVPRFVIEMVMEDNGVYSNDEGEFQRKDC